MSSRYPSSSARAPGKLFLLGEYAVLAGGASIVASTSRGVEVSYDPFQEVDGYTVRGAANLSLDTALPRAAMRAIHMPEECVKHLRADLSELYVERGEKKLGLGSSAASTIASILAIKPELLQARGDLFDAASLAHRELQRGRGSGADVACAAFGGVIGYWLHTPQAPFSCVPEPPRASGASPEERRQEATILPSLKLPEALRIEAVWLGDPASSTELIGRVEQASSTPSRREEIARIFQHISDVALRALDMMRRDEEATSPWLECAREAEQLMRLLGDVTGAPIITPSHDALSHHASQYGVACKPSGAGGGDFSLLWGARDAVDWGALLANLPPGTHHIPMQLGVPESGPALLR